MPGHRLDDIVRRVAGVARFATASDGDLLGRFIADRDGAAFAELVRRHGGMVLGVCRRTLGNTPDAEDACQAAFLVLARKAAAIRRANAVGSWLYGVARGVALRVRSTTARRRESPLVDVPGPDTTADVTWRDGLRVLDEELARLPDAYRAPLVLCYLEGRTQDEAARQLGWSLGSFRGRLERGRARLRARLDRRGVGLAVLAGVAATQPGTAGAVPAGVVGSIVKTATAVAAGEAIAIPAGVAALAEGVIRTMTMTKLSWAAGVLAACGVLTVGGVWATGQRPMIGGGQPPPGVPAAPPAGGDAKREAAVERTAGSAERLKSLNNLKQIMLAIHRYHDANKWLPVDVPSWEGKPLLSWRVMILPYLDKENLYKQFKLRESWDSEHNLKLLAQMPSVYHVGIEPKDSTHTYYQAFDGPNTPLHPSAGPVRAIEPGGGPRIRLSEITDGTSNTLGVVEAGPPVPWTKPADIPFDPAKAPKLVGPFNNALHAATMDGAAFAFKRNLAPDVLRRLIMMNDNEPTPPLKDLLAPRLAETLGEKVQLGVQIAKNQRLIERINQLMKEHVELLAGQNGQPGDLGAAEEMADRLKQFVDELTAMNKKLRDGPREP